MRTAPSNIFSLAWLPALALFTAAGSARANEVSLVYGSACVPEKGHAPDGSDDLAKIAYPAGTQVVKNTSASNAVVHCPIRKYTSGPNSYDDMINSVKATFGGTAAGSSCTVNIWQMGATSTFGLGPFLQDTGSNSTGGAGEITIYTGNPSSSPTHFWGTANEWSYVELTCTLVPGANLTSYTIDEAGTTHGTAIYPASECYRMPDSTGFFNFAGSGTGMLEPNESNGGGFNFGCYLYPNGYAHADFMVGPSIAGSNTSQMQCVYKTTTMVAPQNSPLLTDFPARILSVTRTGSDLWSQIQVPCSMRLTSNGALTSAGDGKIFSYRVY